MIRLGILELIANRHEGSLLFDDIPEPKNGHFNAAQKSLGRRIRKLFDDRRLVFHSFRHNFRDALRAAKIRPEVVAALGGWKLAGYGDQQNYGLGFELSELMANLSKLEYPALQLD